MDKYMIYELVAAGVAVFALLIVGCHQDNREDSGVTINSGQTIRTLGFDIEDYNDIANQLYRSLVRSGRIEQGSVTALGPIADETSPRHEFDPRTLQEMIQVVVHRAGILNFEFITDALEGDSAAEERFEIMKLNWISENTLEGEDLFTIGKIANIDYILFGRVTEQVRESGGMRQITYNLIWQLGNCAEGTVVWNDNIQLTKTGSR